MKSLPKASAIFHKCGATLAEELLDMLCHDIDTHVYYGLAVDAGIDRVKSEHVLISVLYMYVEKKEYVFPALYTSKYKAFDGKLMANDLNTLVGNISQERLLKLKFMMVDGSTVNYVAREACEGHLRAIYERIHPVGASDVEAFERDSAAIRK